MIYNTVYQNEESERKHISMPHRAYEWLKTNEMETATKGLKAYEAILFANEDYRDELDDLEDIVDDRIASLASEKLRSLVEETKKQKGSTLTGSSTQMERVNLHLPVSLTTQTDMRRGWGKMIDESVSVLSASVFNDRFDRVQCKKELVRCMEDNRITPDHWYAKAIVSDNPEELDVNFSTVDEYDLEAVRKAFTRHYEQSDDTADEEDEFFLHSDLTIADLKSYDHSRDGGGITQSKWKKRVRALETAINNEIENGADGYEYMEGEIRGLIDEIYDVGEKTQDKYINEMRITWVDLVDIDADGWAKRVKGLLYDHYFGDKSRSSVGRKVENTPAYKFCLKQKQTIKKATGTMPRELAIKRVENLLDETVVKHKVSGITKRQYEAQATLDDNAENRLEELKMNW